MKTLPINPQTKAVRRQLALPTAPRSRARGFARRGLRLVALLAVLGAPSLARAQAPYRQALLPGLAGFDVGGRSAPALGDLDADGDLDAVTGDANGTLRWLTNGGSSSAPSFFESRRNPFAGIDVGNSSAPTLGDLDADGDLDVVAGETNGTLRYLRNTGSPTSPAFLEATGLANPFIGIDVGASSAPALADLDADGDLDAVIGEFGGYLRYFVNTGSSIAPAFLEATGTSNPLEGINVGVSSKPALDDLDGDGDLDVVIGESYGSAFYYENTGSSTAPAFTEPITNPLEVVHVVFSSAPALADLDGDGDSDAIFGELYGTLRTYRNTGSSTAPAFTVATGTADPFLGTRVIYRSAPALADLDADGDLDAVIGESYDEPRYFRNTGTPTAPSFAEVTGTGNPLLVVGTALYNAAAFADLDADGDLDGVLGRQEGDLRYFRNTGSSTAPVFVATTGIANPFSAIIVNYESKPTFADLDADGDFDLVLGELYGALYFFRNTGSSSAPAFVQVTGTADPFVGLNLYQVAPTLADLDEDGDFDLVIGFNPGTLHLYRNTGSSTVPAFAEATGSADPFAGYDLGTASTPAIGDLDGDGDLDVVSGEAVGTMAYFRSLDVIFADGFESGDASAWSNTVP